MKTPAKINASRDESGKMLIGLDGTGRELVCSCWPEELHPGCL